MSTKNTDVYVITNIKECVFLPTYFGH